MVPFDTSYCAGEERILARNRARETSTILQRTRRDFLFIPKQGLAIQAFRLSHMAKNKNQVLVTTSFLQPGERNSTAFLKRVAQEKRHMEDYDAAGADHQQGSI